MAYSICTYRMYIVSSRKGLFCALLVINQTYFITLFDLIHHNLQVGFTSMSKIKWHYIEYGACAMILLRKKLLVSILSVVRIM